MAVNILIAIDKDSSKNSLLVVYNENTAIVRNGDAPNIEELKPVINQKNIIWEHQNITSGHQQPYQVGIEEQKNRHAIEEKLKRWFHFNRGEYFL